MVSAAFFLLGCSSFEHRSNAALKIADENHYKTVVAKTSIFPIQLFYFPQDSKHAVIYLEGDGLVLTGFGQIALNPTPTDPMALRLSIVDDRPYSKIVINRPFHYLQSKMGNRKYWTTARYAPEVIQSIAEAIRIYQDRLNFKTFEIVAYSGGACVAFLLAPHFKNITKITTFAGNLNHQAWARFHDAQPLFESLNPMDNHDQISKIEQVHYVGTDDDNTTYALAMEYKAHINSSKNTIIAIDGYNHQSDWARVWKEELKLKWQ